MIPVKYALAIVFSLLSTIPGAMIYDLLFGLSRQVLAHLLFVPPLMMAVIILSDAIGLPKSPPSDDEAN